MRRNDLWKECLLYLSVLVIAYALMYVATLIVCWSFALPFSPRYALGVFVICCVMQWVMRGIDIRIK
jgi:hypothetical protein